MTLRTINKLQNWIEEVGLTNDVKIVNTVHDSIYLFIKEDVETIKLVNEKLIEFMTEPYDEDLPVQLEAELDIGYNMTTLITISNDATDEEILKALQTARGEQ